MANDTIGSVPCAFCRCKSPVRKNAKNKLYYVCPGDGGKACGIVQPNMPGFQEWILEHAKIDGPPIELPKADYKVEGIEKDKPTPPAIEQKPTPPPLRAAVEKQPAPTPQPTATANKKPWYALANAKG